MRLRYLADDGEPEPRARHRSRRRRAVEALEDEGPVLLVDPRAVVADGQVAARERDLDRASLAAPLAGVLEQVPDRALHPIAIAVDDGRLDDGCVPRDGRVAGPGALERVLDELVELERLAGGIRAAAGELEEAADE